MRFFTEDTKGNHIPVRTYFEDGEWVAEATIEGCRLMAYSEQEDNALNDLMEVINGGV